MIKENEVGTKVNIPWFLQRATNGVKMAEVHGNTVGDCLEKLVEQFPPIKKELFDKRGELSPFIDIHVGGRSAYSEGLAKPVKDGDEFSILLIIDGG
jgi:molybdopterin converting factor small subunit